MPAFKLLGFMVFAYTVYAIIQGRIYARSGLGGKLIDKNETPDSFWLTVVVYFILSIALCTVF